MCMYICMSLAYLMFSSPTVSIAFACFLLKETRGKCMITNAWKLTHAWQLTQPKFNRQSIVSEKHLAKFWYRIQNVISHESTPKIIAKLSLGASIIIFKLPAIEISRLNPTALASGACQRTSSVTINTLRNLLFISTKLHTYTAGPHAKSAFLSTGTIAREAGLRVFSLSGIVYLSFIEDWNPNSNRNAR